MQAPTPLPALRPAPPPEYYASCGKWKVLANIPFGVHTKKKRKAQRFTDCTYNSLTPHPTNIQRIKIERMFPSYPSTKRSHTKNWNYPSRLHIENQLTSTENGGVLSNATMKKKNRLFSEGSGDVTHKKNALSEPFLCPKSVPSRAQVPPHPPSAPRRIP